MFAISLLRRATIVATLLGVTGCVDFGPMGLGFGGMGMGGGCIDCFAPPAIVTPSSPNILVGDTVRFIACRVMANCVPGKDTGDVALNWVVKDTAVAALVASEPTLALSATTSVLVRGASRGTIELKYDLTGIAYPITIRVADSADIKSIELPRYGLSDTVLAGTPMLVGVNLRDYSGIIYRGASAIVVSDTSVLEVAPMTAFNGAQQLQVIGKKAGTASITATFRNLTATRQITVRQ